MLRITVAFPLSHIVYSVNDVIFIGFELATFGQQQIGLVE